MSSPRHGVRHPKISQWKLTLGEVKAMDAAVNYPDFYKASAALGIARKTMENQVANVRQKMEVIEGGRVSRTLMLALWITWRGKNPVDSV